MYSLCFSTFELDNVTAVLSPYSTASMLDLFFSAVNKRGLILVILVVCANSAVVQNVFQIYGIAVSPASGRAGACSLLSLEGARSLPACCAPLGRAGRSPPKSPMRRQRKDQDLFIALHFFLIQWIMILFQLVTSRSIY